MKGQQDVEATVMESVNAHWTMALTCGPGRSPEPVPGLCDGWSLSLSRQMLQGTLEPDAVQCGHSLESAEHSLCCLENICRVCCVYKNSALKAGFRNQSS